STRRVAGDTSALLASRGFWKAALANGGDHVRSDAAFDRPRSKATLEGLRRRCRGAFQARCITGLDFVPQWSPFAVGNRRIARRRGPAFAIDRLDGNPLKSRRHELRADFFHIVIAMRDAGHEARRVLRKQRRQRLRYDVGKLVFGDFVPHVEKEMAAPLEDAARLPITLNLIGKEHRAELAGYDVKALILERQSERIGLSPRDPAIMRLLLRMIEHRLIEVGGHDARLRRKPRCDRSRQDTGSRGRFQDLPRFNPRQPLGEVARVRLEDERNQEPFVGFRDRSREELVGRRHAAAPSNGRPKVRRSYTSRDVGRQELTTRRQGANVRSKRGSPCHSARRAEPSWRRCPPPPSPPFCSNAAFATPSSRASIASTPAGRRWSVRPTRCATSRRGKTSIIWACSKAAAIPSARAWKNARPVMSS